MLLSQIIDRIRQDKDA
jgi:hypothetical protein